jgi:hypothetical protein
MQKHEVWIETYTGKKFYPFSPNPGEFDIKDIAHSLSNQCRFNGHVKEFYSVAQHCVLIANYLEHIGHSLSYILAGLLHDAGEAYVGDIITPVKRVFPQLAIYEHNLMIRIFRWADIDINRDIMRAVERVDKMILYSEKQVLLGDKIDWGFKSIGVPLFFKIEPWSPGLAESEYLKIYQTLSDKLKYNLMKPVWPRLEKITQEA